MEKKLAKWLFGALAATTLVMTGCTKGPNPADPYEHYNRGMFKFNMGLDKYLFRPTAKVYDVITPPPLQSGITNAFANIDELPSMSNDILQGNFKYIAVDFWRLTINSTFGIGGLFDVATRLGIQPHVETFALTVAKWRGGKSAPYLVLPVFGPSTFQTAIGHLADYFMTPWPYISSQYNDITYSAQAVKFVNIRAGLLPADKLIETAFDPYVFVRDAYMQTTQREIDENEALGKK